MEKVAELNNDLTIAEYKEVRREIIQFQDLQIKILLGIFGFYITIGALIVKYAEIEKTCVIDIIKNDILCFIIMLLVVSLNIIIVTLYIMLNLTIDKASDT